MQKLKLPIHGLRNAQVTHQVMQRLFLVWLHRACRTHPAKASSERNIVLCGRMLFISPALWTQCPCREKAQRTSNALVFLGLISALRIQPYKGTESVSCGSLALRTHHRRAVRRSGCDPQLLLTQQKPCHRKSCELSWWKLMSNKSWLPGSKANSRQRNGNGLSLPQVQSMLVCAV